MARRPDDPRYEETRTDPGRGREMSYDSGTSADELRSASERPERSQTQESPRHLASEPRETRDVAGRRETVPAAQGNGSGIAALVVGLLAVTLAFFIIPAIAAVLLGIVAIILGIVGMRTASRLGGLHKGLSITGVVTGALGLVIGAAVIIGGVTLVDQFGDQLQIEGFELPE